MSLKVPFKLMWPRARYSTPLIQTSRSDDSLAFRLTDRSANQFPFEVVSIEGLSRISGFVRRWPWALDCDWIRSREVRWLGLVPDKPESRLWWKFEFILTRLLISTFLVRISPLGFESILVLYLVPGKPETCFWNIWNVNLTISGILALFAKIIKIRWNWVWVGNWEPESLKRCPRRF